MKIKQPSSQAPFLKEERKEPGSEVGQHICSVCSYFRIRANLSSNSKQDLWHDLVLDQRKAEKPNGEVTGAICHFRSERESGTS